jgi:hypothetical protein
MMSLLPSGRSLLGDRRGESHLIGVILLLGLVVTAGMLTLAVGAISIDSIQQSSDLRASEYGMREVDSRLSQVSAGRTKVQVIDFGTGADVDIDDRSYLNITVNDNRACRIHVPMGSITRETEGGTEITYEGGGVWRGSGNETVMVSPPDLQYESGTINFPVVSVQGELSGSADRLTARRNNTLSAERRAEIRDTLRQPPCRTPINVTMSVTGERYPGWGAYLGEKTDVAPTYDHANDTAAVYVERVGNLTGNVSVDDGSNTLAANSEIVADIEIVGTEGSVVRDGSEWDGDDHNGGAKVELNDPYRVQLRVNGDLRTPWTDGANRDAFELWEDNVNDPRDGEPAVERVVLEPGDTLGVEAAILNCGPGGSYDPEDWEDTGQTESHGGTTYHQLRCQPAEPRTAGDVLDDPQVDIEAKAGGSGSNNLLIRNSTHNVIDGSFEQKAYQKNLKELLGDDIEQCPGDRSKRCANLDDGQYLFVYELSSYLGPGQTEDFNDAVVLVTFREIGNVGADTNFAISISSSYVEIKRS